MWCSSASAATHGAGGGQALGGGRVAVGPAVGGRRAVARARWAAGAARRAARGPAPMAAEPLAQVPAGAAAGERRRSSVSALVVRGMLQGGRDDRGVGQHPAGGEVATRGRSRRGASTARGRRPARAAMRTLWMPEVRRHGSRARAGGWCGQHGGELLLCPRQLPAVLQLLVERRRAARSGPRRRAPRSAASLPAAAGWTSRRPSGPSPA